MRGVYSNTDSLGGKWPGDSNKNTMHDIGEMKTNIVKINLNI